MYRRLVGSRKHTFPYWYPPYSSTVEEIAKVRSKLEDGHGLDDPFTYRGTYFKDYRDFVNKLIREENGVSSRGQSFLKVEGLEVFFKSDEFEQIIQGIVTNPSEETYQALWKFWENQKQESEHIKRLNKLLINRAIAACDKRVTSTVDIWKFNHTLDWLQGKGYVPPFERGSWYHNNRKVMDHLTQVLGNAENEADRETDPIWLSIFYWEIYTHMEHHFQLKKQIVKYGPPGTGKTYQAKELSKLRFGFWQSQFTKTPEGFKEAEAHIELVQFHPSYSYEDFMEGLRPKLDGNLALHNGIFKELCIRAGRWELDVAGLGDEALAAKKWEALKLSDLKNRRESLTGDHWQYLWQVENQDQLLHELIPPYFLIIDEINRAELSRVFGELMYCLEYRGIEGAIKTQYAQLNDEGTGMYRVGEGDYRFFVPHNVYVLGTMNTVDRSVESFDFALRRRFRWEQVGPDISLLRYHLKDHQPEWEGLADNLQSLNKAIREEELLGNDYQIGHAYLWALPYTDVGVDEARSRVWADSIHPLLEEYLRGTGRTKDLMERLKTAFWKK